MVGARPVKSQIHGEDLSDPVALELRNLVPRARVQRRNSSACGMCNDRKQDTQAHRMSMKRLYARSVQSISKREELVFPGFSV